MRLNITLHNGKEYWYDIDYQYGIIFFDPESEDHSYVCGQCLLSRLFREFVVL